ncbi:MAG TPA: lipopolysaccharide biosynthesis protein [Anaeromyxobacteraceae bacterium]|nr:lipopolysaccharide biosynthesis protein [Anaeromyxobacteraceae bacterium]
MQRRDPLELPTWDDPEPSPSRSAPVLWAHLALDAVRRRKLLAAGLFVAGHVATVLFFAWRMHAPTYRVEAQILAQRQQASPSVVHSVYVDNPTRSAWELIHRRDNLIALAQRAGVLPRGASAATPAPGPGPGPAEAGPPAPSSGAPGADAIPDEDDPVERIVSRLDKRLLVTVDEGTIALKLDWGNPREAYEIVQGAIDNFLEARHLQEVAAIDEVLAVLSGRAAVLRRDMEVAAAEARRRPVAMPRTVTMAPRLPSEELVRLQTQFESKQSSLAAIEDVRRRRVADLQTQLDQARNTLSNAHPTIIGLRKDIEALSFDSPQVVTLREEVRHARKAWQDRMVREGFPSVSAPVTTVLPPVDLGSREEDPRARELRIQYESLAMQLQTAQVERDAARAAFKHRYNVIWPPQIPREPVSPDAGKIFSAGLLASLLLAIAGAAAPDLIRGRIVQRWQVEQVLGLEVLGELGRGG